MGRPRPVKLNGVLHRLRQLARVGATHHLGAGFKFLFWLAAEAIENVIRHSQATMSMRRWLWTNDAAGCPHPPGIRADRHDGEGGRKALHDPRYPSRVAFL